MDGALFRATVETDGQMTVIGLSGDIALSTAPIVESQFQGLAEAGLTEVVIDATHVNFIDSTGLSALLAGQELIHSRGSSFLVVPSRPMERLLALVSGRTPAMTIVDTVSEAIEILRQDQIHADSAS